MFGKIKERVHDAQAGLMMGVIKSFLTLENIAKARAGILQMIREKQAETGCKYVAVLEMDDVGTDLNIAICSRENDAARSLVKITGFPTSKITADQISTFINGVL